MNEELKLRYIKSMEESYTKEQLIEMVMKRDDRICEFRAFVNQIFAGSPSLVLHNCIEKLAELNETELSGDLEEVRRYLTHGNEFLLHWVKGE